MGQTIKLEKNSFNNKPMRHELICEARHGGARNSSCFWLQRLKSNRWKTLHHSTYVIHDWLLLESYSMGIVGHLFGILSSLSSCGGGVFHSWLKKNEMSGFPDTCPRLIVAAVREEHKIFEKILRWRHASRKSSSPHPMAATRHSLHTHFWM